MTMKIISYILSFSYTLSSSIDSHVAHGILFYALRCFLFKCEAFDIVHTQITRLIFPTLKGGVLRRFR